MQAAETELEKERYPIKFEINMVRCIFCGFCEEVCPEEAIVMSQEYLLVFSSQEEALFGKEKLLKINRRIERAFGVSAESQIKNIEIYLNVISN